MVVEPLIIRDRFMGGRMFGTERSEVALVGMLLPSNIPDRET